MENGSFGETNGDRGPVPAVGKAVRVLEAIAAQERPLGVSEIARRTGLSKSTTHSLLAALSNEDLIAASSSGGYQLGHRLARLSDMAAEAVILELAHESLREITERTGETAFFGRLENDVVRILEREESRRTLKLSAPVGSSVPVLAGALGKMLLARTEPDVARRFLESYPLRRYTERSITDQDAFIGEAAVASERGFALDRGEYLPGVVAAASSMKRAGETYFIWTVGIERSGVDLEETGQAVACAASRMVSELVRAQAPAERTA